MVIILCGFNVYRRLLVLENLQVLWKNKNKKLNKRTPPKKKKKKKFFNHTVPGFCHVTSKDEFDGCEVFDSDSHIAPHIDFIPVVT